MPSVSYEYGKALYELSCELSLSDEYLLAIRQIREIFKSNGEIISILASPVITKQERVEIIDRIFATRIDTHIIAFLKLLTERGRAKIKPDCLDEFERLWYENSGIVIAEAVSATTLTDEQKIQLHKSLEDRTGMAVELRTKVDPSLLGGVRITINGEMIDGSIKGRLERLKEDIITNNTVN
jgi:F-type H+-transporting ATPase subunit delta